VGTSDLEWHAGYWIRGREGRPDPMAGRRPCYTGSPASSLIFVSWHHRIRQRWDALTLPPSTSTAIAGSIHYLNILWNNCCKLQIRNDCCKLQTPQSKACSKRLRLKVLEDLYSDLIYLQTSVCNQLGFLLYRDAPAEMKIMPVLCPSLRFCSDISL
jgi:hypothetical protein